MVPREVEVVDALPINGNGKIDYPELRNREFEKDRLKGLPFDK